MTAAQSVAKQARRRLLIVSFTPTAREPRALKQAAEFASRYDVTTAGFGEVPDSSTTHIELTTSTLHSGSRISRLRYLVLLALRQYRWLERVSNRNRDAFAILSQHEWDVVVAHDVHTVALAQQLRPTAGVLVDLHEYAPRQNEHSFVWRMLIAPYFRWILATHVSQAEAVTTVSQGIVEEYSREFGITAELVVNATPYQDLDVQPVGSPIRLVHSGIPGRARKLEVMIDAVRETSANVSLDLYLMKDGSDYYHELVERAAGTDKIRFMEPVPYNQLVKTLNHYDVGISILPPTTFNLAWCLPNKFFDFVQARLGVIIGPSPEMARYVEKHGIGAVTSDFSVDAFRALLENLTPAQVAEWKVNSDRSAQELSSAEQVKVWGRIVDDMVKK